MTNEDIIRVKGLGCLRDKTTEDCFNVRVITKNGKITADECSHICEAARLFGNILLLDNGKQVFLGTAKQLLDTTLIEDTFNLKRITADDNVFFI